MGSSCPFQTLESHDTESEVPKHGLRIANLIHLGHSMRLVRECIPKWQHCHTHRRDRTYLAKKRLDIGESFMPTPCTGCGLEMVTRNWNRDYIGLRTQTGETTRWPNIVMALALEKFNSSPAREDVKFTVKFFPFQLYPDARKEGEDEYEW